MNAINPITVTDSAADADAGVVAPADLMAAITRQVNRLLINNHPGIREKTAQSALRSVAGLVERLGRQQALIDTLQAQAVTDALTGLLNRRGFMVRLETMLANARRYGETGLLIYIDLDDFKPVNDSLGHAAGDAVLRFAAAILGRNVRQGDFVARLGGDEFAVVLGRSDPAHGIKRVRILEHLMNAAVVPWQGRAIPMRASFGVRTFTAGDTADGLLAAADNAMYRAKRQRAGGPVQGA